MPATLNLVNASVGKRAGAKLLDAVPVLVLSGIGMLLGLAQVTGTATTTGEMLAELTSLAIFNSITALLCLAYWAWLWGWEATRGNSIGNAILGIRTTSLEGFRAGWGAIFVRGLIIWLGALVVLVGAVIVLISNLWDRNARRQGWHDMAAKTYVFDIRAGRNPMVTGGVPGPEAFAPTPLPSSVQSAVSAMDGGRGSVGLERPSATENAPQTAPKDPHEQTTGPGPDAPRTTDPMDGPVISSVPGSATEAGNSSDSDAARDGGARTSGEAVAARRDPVAHPDPVAGQVPAADPDPVAGQVPAADPERVAGQVPAAESAPTAHREPVPDPASAAHPDDDVEATRITRRAAKPQVRVVLDDGRELELRSAALVGRNPAGRPSEAVDQLIDVPDLGRSVSKTHLHLRVEAAAIWVTDRNSTNGSAISTPDGTRTALPPGQAVRADAGSTVHFGDRSFLVGTA
ncbi:RDD family protein [Arthrobacter castelli]|uniref:RDD family protein n=1 Tax=Arthrobacter castelli TaxID=271431 RepID=UPI0004020E03|nr:RDD family protein [Arthrobacter castelli]